MFRSARWRSEKNKIKAVFKLQLHATQLSQFGGDALMISLVPADTGKPTVRSEKAAVEDGSCFWENPMYETIQFVREPKTGKIHERVYHFSVSTRSRKTGLVGEVSLDFADYAESTKISSVSLPLENEKSKSVLHVTIQRMQESVDHREVGEIECVKHYAQDRSLRTQLSNDDTDEHMNSNDIEDGPCEKTISHFTDLNGNRWISSGSDTTMSVSENSSGLDTPRQHGIESSNTHHDPTSVFSSLNHVSLPQKPINDASTTIDVENQRSQWEWLGGSAPEASTDGSSGSPSRALSRERSQDASDVVIENLRTELAVLARQAEVSELELQTLRRQVVKESKRGQDLSRELIIIKHERDAFKEECEKLQQRIDQEKVKNKLLVEGGDSWAILEELKQELSYERDLNANLRLQLQKTQESNSELILAVRDLDGLLEQKNNEMFDLSNKSGRVESGSDAKLEIDDDEEQKALEELVNGHSDAKEAYLLEQKIMGLYNEIEIYRREKDELETQMEQLALDYEILKQENHKISCKLEQSQLQEQLKIQYECSTPYDTINELEAQIERLESDLKKQSQQLSNSQTTMKELEIQVKSLEEELEEQAQGFETDLESLTRAKIEQEQRALHAEETLRKTRLKNANTAEKLQAEFKKLSTQVASSFDANEKLATNTLMEANELRQEKIHLEGLLHKTQEELQSIRDYHEAKVCELSSHLSWKTNQIGQMQSEIEDKSVELEQQKKHLEETQSILSQEILMLKAQVERLISENNAFSKLKEQEEAHRVELDQMKKSIKESEMLLEISDAEKRQLQTTVALVNKEAMEALQELSSARCLKNEMESLVEHLQVEIESLKSQCDDMKHSLFEDEVEKEKLRKQVFQLKNNLKKEDAAINIEKKLKDTNSRPTVLEGSKGTLRNNKYVSLPRGTKELATLKETIKSLENQIKQKETDLETLANSFLEKEKDLQNKIDELERKLEELHDKSSILCKYEIEKVNKLTADFSPMAFTSNEDGYAVSLIKSSGDCLSKKDVETFQKNTSNQRELDELVSQVALLKERNTSMEDELKEMQERYSEISLKFAEVEGERQQLVMKLRNLKNGKKN